MSSKNHLRLLKLKDILPLLGLTDMGKGLHFDKPGKTYEETLNQFKL